MVWAGGEVTWGLWSLVASAGPSQWHSGTGDIPEVSFGLEEKSLRNHGVKLSEERYRGSPSILGSMEAFNSIEDIKSNDEQWGCC